MRYFQKKICMLICFVFRQIKPKKYLKKIFFKEFSNSDVLESFLAEYLQQVTTSIKLHI